MERPILQMSVAKMLGLVACIALNFWLFRVGIFWGILGLNVTKHVAIAYLCEVVGVDRRRASEHAAGFRARRRVPTSPRHDGTRAGGARHARSCALVAPELEWAPRAVHVKMPGPFDQEASMDRSRAGKLLLVEDEHVLRGLIARFLRGEGFEVVEAGDGAQGVSLYSLMRPFDVVLLDLNLPLVPGVDVCRHIKSLDPSQPVIICSAAILDDHFDALRAMGVEQFLTKPYHPMELVKRIAAESSAPRSVESIHPASEVRGPHWRRDQLERGPGSSHPLAKSPFID